MPVVGPRDGARLLTVAVAQLESRTVVHFWSCNMRRLCPAWRWCAAGHCCRQFTNVPASYCRASACLLFFLQTVSSLEVVRVLAIHRADYESIAERFQARGALILLELHV